MIKFSRKAIFQVALILKGRSVLRINPNFSLDHFARTALVSYKDQSEIDKVVNAMRKAGLK